MSQGSTRSRLWEVPRLPGAAREKPIFRITALTLTMPLLSAAAAPSSDRDAKANGVSIEVLGRSVVYGAQWDRAWDDHWGIGLGMAKVEADGGGESSAASTALVPVFANYYFSPLELSWFATAGVTFVTHPGGVQGRGAILGTLRFPSIPLLPNLGVGYEIRQSQGFLFRLQGLLTQGEAVSISTGFSLGYVF